MSNSVQVQSGFQPASKFARLQTGLVFLFLLLFLVYTYTFLHESGHALLGLLFGGRLTSFSVDFVGFTAHVGLDGQFTRGQNTLISIAGIALPLVLWSLYLLLASRRQAENPLLGWLLFSGSLTVYSTLLAWIIIPLLLLAGRQVGDDSANFTSLSGLHPLLVSASALALYAGGMALALRRLGGQAGLRGLALTLRSSMLLTPAARRLLARMAGLLGVLVAATLALQAAAGIEAAESIPEGYLPVFEAHFAERARAGEAVYRLHLDSTSRVGFYLVLEDFQRGPLEIILTGPEGFSQGFLRFENDPRIGHATVSPEPQTLEPGDYELRVTAPQAPARLSGYVQIRP